MGAEKETLNTGRLNNDFIRSSKGAKTRHSRNRSVSTFTRSGGCGSSSSRFGHRRTERAKRANGSKSSKRTNTTWVDQRIVVIDDSDLGFSKAV
jgi:hypothetical protein